MAVTSMIQRRAALRRSKNIVAAKDKNAVKTVSLVGAAVLGLALISGGTANEVASYENNGNQFMSPETTSCSGYSTAAGSLAAALYEIGLDPSYLDQLTTHPASGQVCATTYKFASPLSDEPLTHVSDIWFQ